MSPPTLRPSTPTDARVAARGWLLSGALLSTALLGCAPPGTEAAAADVGVAVDDAPLAEIACALEVGEPVPYVEDAAAKAASPDTERVLFLNGAGGTFRPGDDDDSSADRSSLVRHATTIPAYQGASTSWDEAVSCVRQTFGRWRVRVTEQDPGDAPHIEVAVGGSPALLGHAPGVGGVAQLSGSYQDGAPRVNERAIVFVFSEHPGLVHPTDLCVAIAHEIGHALSLDHVTRCGDIMSYGACRPATFTVGESPCGTTDPRECITSTTQNPRARLDWLLGRKNGATPGNQAPFVKVLSPRSQRVDAGDPVELLVRIWDDGGEVSARTTWSFAGSDDELPLQTVDGVLFRSEIPTDDGASGEGRLRALATDDRGATTRSAKQKVSLE